MLLMDHKLLKVFLKLVGLSPYDFDITGPMMIASTVITLIPFVLWNAIIVAQDLVQLINVLTVLLAVVGAVINTCIMWKNKRKNNDIFKNLQNDWNTKEIPDGWKIIAQTWHIYFTILVSTYAVTGLNAYMNGLFSYFVKHVEDRVLLLPAFYPFDYRRSPVFEAIGMMHSIQGVMLLIADATCQSLLVGSVLHICAQIELLNSYIYVHSSNMNMNNNSIITQTSSKDIVKQHLKVLTLVQKIDECYSYVSFFQIGFSSLLICLDGYALVIAMESADILLLVKYILFIFAALLQGFVYCFIGQYLQNKGDSISSTLCDYPWYDASPNEIRTMIFILMKTQVPLTLTSGKIFELSLTTFTKILKTSMSYLSVLRAIFSD